MTMTQFRALVFALFVLSILVGCSFADIGPDPKYKRLREVVDSKTLSREEKVRAIQEVLAGVSRSVEPLLIWIADLSPTRSR